MSLIERMLGVPPAPPAVDRINDAVTRRPRLPLIAMGIVVVGLLLIVALTISAGAHSDNFNDEGPGGTLSALTFRPWFRIALLAGVGIILGGIIVMLLAIVARIRWLTFVLQRFAPLAADGRRQREGRAFRFKVKPATGNGDK